MYLLLLCVIILFHTTAGLFCMFLKRTCVALLDTYMYLHFGHDQLTNEITRLLFKSEKPEECYTITEW